jgi:hypothetical protein
MSLFAAVQFVDENGNKITTKDDKNDKKEQRQQKKEELKEEKKIPNDPKMVKKLESIIIPKVEMEKISIIAALKQLNELSILNDPDKKGITFSMDTDDQLIAKADAIITFTKENVSLETVLKVVCRQSGYKYLATPEGVKISKPDGKKKENDNNKL